MEGTVDEVDNNLRNGGYDGGEDQDGDTVADTLFVNPFAHPHQECGTCGAAEADRDIGHNAVHEGSEAGISEPGDVLEQISVAAAETDNDTYGLNQCKTDADIAGSPLDLLLTVFLTRELLKLRECDGEELQDNGSGDVG